MQSVCRKRNMARHAYYLTQLEAEALKMVALKHDYKVDRGPHTGEGSISKLLQALARGEITLAKGDT